MHGPLHIKVLNIIISSFYVCAQMLHLRLVAVTDPSNWDLTPH